LKNAKSSNRADLFFWPYSQGNSIGSIKEKRDELGAREAAATKATNLEPLDFNHILSRWTPVLVSYTP